MFEYNGTEGWSYLWTRLPDKFPFRQKKFLFNSGKEVYQLPNASRTTLVAVWDVCVCVVCVCVCVYVDSFNDKSRHFPWSQPGSGSVLVAETAWRWLRSSRPGGGFLPATHTHAFSCIPQIPHLMHESVCVSITLNWPLKALKIKYDDAWSVTQLSLCIYS